MTLASMTGFARHEGSLDDFMWTWELKGVNGRNLDLRCRLPTGYESLDSFVRAATAEKLKRGNLTIVLNIDERQSKPVFKLNEYALAQIVAALDGLKDRFDAAPPRLDGLIGLKGVLEVEEEEVSPELAARRTRSLQDSFITALNELVKMRLAEGRTLGDVIGLHLSEIDRLRQSASSAAAAQPEAIRARLTRQIEELLPPHMNLSDERLAQEVALLATRADIREELDRLGAHISAARQLVADGGAVGRKFDFLCQEFNREANTLCAKADDLSLTNLGIELKAAIEQLREQVQNIE